MSSGWRPLHRQFRMSSRPRSHPEPKRGPANLNRGFAGGDVVAQLQRSKRFDAAFRTKGPLDSFECCQIPRQRIEPLSASSKDRVRHGWGSGRNTGFADAGGRCTRRGGTLLLGSHPYKRRFAYHSKTTGAPARWVDTGVQRAPPSDDFSGSWPSSSFARENLKSRRRCCTARYCPSKTR